MSRSSQHATNAIPCGTRAPTATPTPTPRPSCISTTATAPDVIGSAGTPTAPLQGQVSTYNGLTFMVVDITGASTGTLPNTGYLWPPNTSPSIQRPVGTPSLNWGGNEIIAYLGVIPWIDPNIKWVQLVWPINGTSSVLIGFMDARTIVTDCDYAGLNVIRDSRLPIVAPATFAAPVATGVNPTYVSPFGRGNAVPTPIAPTALALNQLPPAHMGTYGLHWGPNPPLGAGSTLDVVPVNSELCIDTDATLSNCDPVNPNVRIPIYAPASGCAVFSGSYGSTTNPPTVEIFLDRVNASGQPDCGNLTATGDRIIVLTHLRDSVVTTNPSTVVVGQFIGNLCRHNERTTCGIVQNASNIPTHLAVQLKIWQPSYPPPPHLSGFTSITDVYREMRGILAIPYCLYDTWQSTQGSTPITPAPTFVACPQ